MLSKVLLKNLALTTVLLKDFCVVESVFEFLNESCVVESVVERLLCCRKCCRKTLVSLKTFLKDLL